MSWLPAIEPSARPDAAEAIDLVIEPVSKDLGGFSVRRALPSPKRRLIGPFIFLDHMGPAILPPGEGMDVRPHPHIGLATLTYLTDGAIRHRDSLGTALDIVPGEVNWMTAGRGIVHSERSPPEARTAQQRVSGIQSWVALPSSAEEVSPAFHHADAADLPLLEDRGVSLRLIVGELFGAASPVPALSPTLYADVTLAPGAALPFPAAHAERAIYVLDGEIEVAGDVFSAHRLLILRPGDVVTIRSDRGARMLLLGGEPLDGPRHIWWNFVSSRPERIESAKADWAAGRFEAVPGEAEFIPLPHA